MRGNGQRKTGNTFISNPHAGIDFRQQSNNQYGAVIIRVPVPEKRQPVFSVFPELDEWDHLVQAVLVAGTAGSQTALLIELVPSQNSEKTFHGGRAHAIERIWHKIEEANQEYLQHAKVAKTHILFTTPEEPMERASKGTIQRKPTLDLHSEELDKLYTDADKMSTSAPAGISLPQDGVDLTESNSIALFIHNIIAQLIGTNCFQDGDNLFAHGLIESLQTLSLTRVLKQTFVIPNFDISTVYSNPHQSTRSQMQPSIYSHRIK
ncbi:uncharacterized protein EAF01_009343 [Botrytis porri]|uniref:uncharacterized protein n=1 Tax=Botrytis porri TaxID=87229 RepID=UPI0019025ED7|nr:uncharacterized protein EAF01_009343 [Botrytis porri]KAF7896940.1 hypothetical protein EAF01_009343 [Botrytis porri]